MQPCGRRRGGRAWCLSRRLRGCVGRSGQQERRCAEGGLEGEVSRDEVSNGSGVGTAEGLRGADGVVANFSTSKVLGSW